MAVLLTALCLVGTMACGAPPQPPPSIAKFAISYQRSGGLKAESRSLEITPGRHATAARLGSTARFRVGPRRVRHLRGALERANFTRIEIPTPAPGNCADCFLYDITYRGHEVSFSQVDQPRRLGPAIEQLEALIESHLPFH